MKKIFFALLGLLATTHLAYANGKPPDREANHDAVKISYKLGKGLSFESPKEDFKIILSAFVQPRFTYTSLEAAPDTDTFAINRGKILLNGYVAYPSLQFFFMADFATRAANSGVGLLNDYYIDWVPSDYFGIKVGQFKVPFIMQEVTSDTKNQFVDRSLINGIFSLVRDIGLTFHGSIFSKKLGYDFFIMNGDGANTINTNQGLMGGTRLEWSFLGKYDRSEGDLEESESPNLGVGLAYVFHDSLNSTGALAQSGTIVAGTRASLGTFDAGYKYKGFSLQGAGMGTKTHEGASVTNWGFNGQAGYFIVPKHFEVAAKGGAALFDGIAVNQYEYALGLNYFFKGHAVKLQTDYTYLVNTRGTDLIDHRLRTQAQVIF